MAERRDRQENLRIAADKLRLKKEKEEREENEFYERITSGFQWLFFKIVVIFCTSMLIITTVEFFVDGSTKKLTEESWQLDRNWEYRWHKVLDVEGYMFTPHLSDWSIYSKNTLKLTYSPIFKVGKKLSYDVKYDGNRIRKHVEIRQRSIFTWFPVLQIFLLIPLVTFFFKRKNAVFNFARITSLAVVLPGTLMIIYYAIF